jgi:hypothetical protein
MTPENYTKAKNLLESGSLDEGNERRLFEAVSAYERDQQSPPRQGVTELLPRGVKLNEDDPFAPTGIGEHPSRSWLQEQVGSRDLPEGPIYGSPEADAPVVKGRIRGAGDFKKALAPSEWRDSSLKSNSGDMRYYAPPATHGGSVMDAQLWFEPSTGDAERMLAKSERLRARLGVKGEDISVDKDSELYKQLSDAMWQDAYSQAKSQGRTLIRHEHGSGDMPAWAKKSIEYGGRGLETVTQGVMAFDKGFTGGIATGLARGIGDSLGLPASEDMQDTYEQAPLPLKITGEIAGAVTPGSVPSGLYRALAPKLGGGLRGAIGAGAATGAAEGAWREGVEALSEPMSAALEPEEIRAEAEDQEAVEEYMKRRAMEMALGGALGGGFHGLGKLAEASMRGLRAKSPQLQVAEKAGVRTSSTKKGGLDVPRTLKGHIDESVVQGSDPGVPSVSPQELAMAGVDDAIVAQGRELASTTRERIGKQTQEYYLTPEGQTQHSVAPLFTTAMRVIRSARKGGNELGDRLPMEEAVKLGPITGRMLRGRVVTAEQARQLGEQSYTLAEAKSLFGSEFVERVAKKSRRKGLKGKGGGGNSRRIVVEPKDLDASELDQVIAAYDELAKQSATKQSSRAESIWNELSAAARKTRDQFAPNSVTASGGEPSSFGAMKARHHRAISEVEGVLQATGVPPKGQMTANQRQTLRNRMSGVFGPQRQEADAAFLKLADAAGLRQELLDIGALRALGELGQIGESQAAEASMALGARAAGIPGFLPGLGRHASSLRRRADGIARAFASGDLNLSPRLRGVLGEMRQVRPASMKGGAAARPTATLSDEENLAILLDVAELIDEEVNADN